MLSKKLILTVILIAVLILVLTFLYFIGEGVKQEYFSSTSSNPDSIETITLGTNPSIEDPAINIFSRGIAFSTLLVYLTPLNKSPDKNSPEFISKVTSNVNTCASDNLSCLDLITFADNGKQICSQAITSSKELGNKIKSENSILLGFYKLVFNVDNLGYASVVSSVTACYQELSKIKL